MILKTCPSRKLRGPTKLRSRTQVSSLRWGWPRQRLTISSAESHLSNRVLARKISRVIQTLISPKVPSIKALLIRCSLVTVLVNLLLASLQLWAVTTTCFSLLPTRAIVSTKRHMRVWILLIPISWPSKPTNTPIRGRPVIELSQSLFRRDIAHSNPSLTWTIWLTGI